MQSAASSFPSRQSLENTTSRRSKQKRVNTGPGLLFIRVLPASWAQLECVLVKYLVLPPGAICLTYITSFNFELMSDDTTKGWRHTDGVEQNIRRALCFSLTHTHRVVDTRTLTRMVHKHIFTNVCSEKWKYERAEYIYIHTHAYNCIWTCIFVCVYKYIGIRRKIASVWIKGRKI